MMRRPTDFLGLTNTLRSLTMSPGTAAIQEAHRMARRRLEAGGPAAPRHAAVDDQADPNDVLLPADIDDDQVLKAVEAELRRRGVQPADAPPLIAKRAGGRVVVPGVHVLRLGGGHHGRGRRFLYAVISEIRGKRGRLGQPKSGRLLSGLAQSSRPIRPR